MKLTSLFPFYVLVIASSAQQDPTTLGGNGTISAQDDRTNSTRVNGTNADEDFAQYHFYNFKNCNDGEKKQILDALKEKDTLTGADSSQKINWNGALAIDFFGSAYKVRRYRDDIQNNFKWAYQFGNGWTGTANNTQVFCHDGSMDGPKKDDCKKKAGIHIHLAKNYTNSEDAIMVCDTFFKLPSLSDILEKGKKSDNPLDLHQYENRAVAMIALVLQKDDTRNFPSLMSGGTLIGHRMTDFFGKGTYYITTPSAIKYVGKQRPKDWADVNELVVYGNSDTYAWFAMAGWLQERGQLDAYPGYPLVPGDKKFVDNLVKVSDEAAKAEDEFMKQGLLVPGS